MKNGKAFFAGIFFALLITVGMTAGVYWVCPVNALNVSASENSDDSGEEDADESTNAIITVDDLGLMDGSYQIDVTLSGGSGKASVESPATIAIADGQVTATIIFSSSYYDYMLIDGERYEPVNTEGNSAFEIPVDGFDYEMAVTADTTAMSTPHEIEYTLYFDSSTICEVASDEDTDDIENTKTNDVDAAEGGNDTSYAEDGDRDVETDEADGNTDKSDTEETSAVETTAESMYTQETDMSDTDTSETGERNYPSGEDWCGLTWESSLELLYAEMFTVDYYEGGYARIVIADEDVFLVIPEDAGVPDSLDRDVTVLQQPIENIYLVATSAMDFFCSLDALDFIRLSGTNASGWYIEAAQEAMEAGDILYAGKYSAPDYELILAENCGLAIESTMIYHNPEVQEKLEAFGIPVLVERSSYESHPMGRTEWMKLYAVLLGKEEEAEEIFNEQVARVQEVETSESLGKTVAFFYITSTGSVNVRKSNDYVAKMIELAGGTYIFDDLGEDDSAVSTVNMTMEEFYAQAIDADYIIYNSTIDGEIYTLDELYGKSALLADFKAVQEGNVWCTGKNLFQETTSLGDLIVEIHTILADEDVEDSELNYLHRIIE